MEGGKGLLYHFAHGTSLSPFAGICGEGVMLAYHHQSYRILHSIVVNKSEIKNNNL
jgi:hypothetical protein